MKKQLLSESPDSLRYKGEYYSCNDNGQPAFITKDLKSYFAVKDPDNAMYHADLDGVINGLNSAINDEDEGYVDEFAEDYSWNASGDLSEIFWYSKVHKLRKFNVDTGEDVMSSWDEIDDFRRIVASSAFDDMLRDTWDLKKEDILYDIMYDRKVVDYDEFMGIEESTKEEKHRQKQITYWMSILHTSADAALKKRAVYELKKLGVDIAESDGKDPKNYPEGMSRAEYRSIRYPQESFNDIVGNVIEEEINTIYSLPSPDDKVSLMGVLDVIMTTVSK